MASLRLSSQTTCTKSDNHHVNLAQLRATFAIHLQATRRYAPLAILCSWSVHIIQRPPVCKLPALWMFFCSLHQLLMRPQLMCVAVKTCICINMLSTSSRPPWEHAKPYWKCSFRHLRPQCAKISVIVFLWQYSLDLLLHKHPSEFKVLCRTHMKAGVQIRFQQLLRMYTTSDWI